MAALSMKHAANDEAMELLADSAPQRTPKTPLHYHVTFILDPRHAHKLPPREELAKKLHNPYVSTVPFEIFERGPGCWAEWLDAQITPLAEAALAWQAEPRPDTLRKCLLHLHCVAYSAAGLLLMGGWVPPLAFESWRVTFIDPSSKSVLWQRFAESNPYTLTNAILQHWDQLPDWPPRDNEGSSGRQPCDVEWLMPKPQGRWFKALEGEERAAGHNSEELRDFLSDSAMEVCTIHQLCF